MKIRALAVVIGASIAVATLAGCDPSSSAASSAPNSTAVPTITSTSAATAAPSTDLLAGRVLPLFAYQESPESSFAASRAVAILKNQCLARFGFQPLAVPTSNPASPPMYRVFGITDPAIAAKYGYHLDPVGMANDASAAPARPTYTPEMQLVLLGYAPGGEVPDMENPSAAPTPTYQGKTVPPLGCQGEAVRTLDPPNLSGDELNLPQSLGADAYARAVADKRMKAATTRWGACMKAAGFPGRYTEPSDALAKFNIENPLTTREIATAVADVGCRGETKLVDTWFAVESEYENTAIQNNIETLTKVKAARDAALAKALEIVGNGGK